MVSESGSKKVAVGAIRTALQTWLAPQLSDIGQRLTHVEARLDGIDQRLYGIDQRLDGMDRRFDAFDKYLQETLRSIRNEMEARFDTVRSDIKRLDNIAELRERLAAVEAKMAQRN